MKKDNLKYSQRKVVQRFSVIKVFLEISQKSQENTCAKGSFSIKLQASGGCFATLLKLHFAMGALL